jgi:hypothetical protein
MNFGWIGNEFMQRKGCQDLFESCLSLESAAHHLHSNLPSAVDLVESTASSAYGSSRYLRQAVSQHNGTDTNYSDKYEEQQYLHEAPLLPLQSDHYNKRYFNRQAERKLD